LTKYGAINYRGNYEKGKYSGKGELYYNDGGIYKGNFSEGKRNG